MDEHAHHKDNNEGLYAVSIAIVVSVIILSGVVVYAANSVNGNLAAMNSNLANLKINVNANIPTGGQDLQGTPIPTQVATPTPAPAKPVVKLEGLTVKGKESAPITIVEYSDFQCPYCERFYSETLPSIVKDWVDTGKAKIYFKHFPLSFHQNAQKSAEASECAKDQGKFWEMHDKLFDNQAALTVTDLKKYAADLKLDTAKFNTCLDGGSKAAIVNEQMAEGAANGVSGTPAFLINGQLVVGAQPYAVFNQALSSMA